MTARTLLVFPPKFGLPSASPFSTKALILLEMAGLDYEARSGNPTKAPKRKLPVLIEDGKTIADSFFIRRALLQNSDFGRFTSWIHAVRRAA